MRVFILAALALTIIAVVTGDILNSWVESQPQTVAENAPTNSAPDRTRRNTRNGDVQIHAAADGHYYLDAEIDGRDIAVMVDTGASIVALRESDARRAGIRVHRADFTAALSTANGKTYAAPVTLRSVAVDNIEIRNVRAVIVPDKQLSISLLGASFLNQLQRFEVSDNTLIFEN